jgi:Tol biopolymer transport system component
MAERWQRELRRLRELQPPERLWIRIEAMGPEREPSPRFLPRILTIGVAMAVAAVGVAGLVATFLAGSEPVSLPTNGLFVYADRGPQPPEIPFENLDLFAFDPATGDRTNLTNTTTVAESSPVWSLDGRRVVYERASAEGATFQVTYDLVVANGDGTDLQVIRACGSDRCGVFGLVWSPDESRLAWTGSEPVDDGSVVALEVHDLQAGRTTVVCDSRECDHPGQPVWSPDGFSIAFSNAGPPFFVGPISPTGPIWLANIKTGQIKALTGKGDPCDPASEGCPLDSDPVWSPDGTSIAFVRTTRAGESGATTDVMLADADGSDQRTLSACASHDQCRQGPLAWSPDGSLIAFFERYDQTTLTLVDPTTGRMRGVSLPSDVGDPYELHWSPDGNQLAFVGGPARASNLYVVEVSTGEAGQVAEGIARQGDLAWLPEGAIDLSKASSAPVTTPRSEPTIPVPAGNIVFASSNGSIHEDDGVEIWTIALDGSGLTRLTKNDFMDGDPAVSPDGTEIVFRSYRPGDRNTQLYVMNADGTEQHALTDRRTGATQPAWSPDGARIAFVSGAGYGEPGGIFVMNADGSGLKLVAEGNGFDPSWSPDGSKVVYALNTPDGHVGLAVVDLADGAVTQLPALPGEQYKPAWSADGQTIAFEWATTSGTGLYVMALDGSGLRRLAEGSAPVWSPDGSWLAYSHLDDETGPQIWIVAADGSGARSITSMRGFLPGTGIAAITSDPSWAPAEG